ILFVVAVLVVTALSTAYGVNQASESVRDSIVERQQKSGSAAATALTYFLDSTRQALISTAAVLSATDLSAPGGGNAGPLLDPLISSNRDFSVAAVLRPDGTAAITRPVAAPLPPGGYANNPAFIEAKNSGLPSLTLALDDLGPHWIVAIPPSQGEPGYFLMGRLRQSFVEEILFSNIDPSSTGLVVNPERIVLATTDPTFTADSTRDWDALSGVEATQSGAVEAAEPTNGDEVILVRTPVDRYPAQIAVMSPRTELDELQSGLIQSAILTSAVLATVAAVVGIVATNAILRPVTEVREATHRMRGGDLAARAKPRGASEFRELAQDFNAMASTLSSEWEQRVKLQNHLEEIVKERTQQLNQRQEDMELFFYGVSHDFKSPVISISNITQMLEEAIAEKRIDREALKELSRRIRNSSLNLQTLIGELLEFAQAERVAPKYHSTSTRAIVGPVLEEAQPQASAKKIRLESKGASIMLETDPERVRHILGNLVSNAIKYMPDRNGSWVRIEWSKVGEELEIRVMDNGDGIPESVRPQLFRPFSRYAPAGSKVAGAGLGLSIVKRLTETLRGTVELETKAHLGTTFKVRLPLKRPRADPRGAA
ncbi:MAG TPA: sensor histidine kinase, partial [Candidatus Thermoplasmatota archaeon]